MAWTAPRTWSTGELVTATIMNTHIRDNLDALKDPPTNLYNVDEASNYSTTSTSFADVDSTDLALAITTGGGDVMIGFSCNVVVGAASDKVYFNVMVDGVDDVADDGLIGISASVSSVAAPGEPITFTYLKQGLSAASHTFKLRWKVDTGTTATLYAGAGTASGDMHPQFWVREVS